ncbi:hypothetical protein J7E88_22295 [Streptomyces sp. ISL-10]|uniref:hypothetical protein n=1 Tax=Streptomyces sp. ISL-10 TaxID=2819172 RepID=UPI001BE61E80|nr:hypothetical protein [Streptomyces sp. ISL-10]MBT2367968.1 hypothetical protein [Streptomyces sp. ISL-10]
MAQRVGMERVEAVQLVTPQAVAEIIMKAATEVDQSASVRTRCGRSGSTTARSVPPSNRSATWS